jgi:uncharacterized protein YndB with AHSA1/START domain
MDDSFIPAPPVRLAAYFAEPALWRSWWPDLELRVCEDRAAEGIRWEVSGPLDGRAEVWIEEYGRKGSIVHFFLRADPPHPYRWRTVARGRRLTHRYRTAWKARIHALGDRFEAEASESARPAASGAQKRAGSS